MASQTDTVLRAWFKHHASDFWTLAKNSWFTIDRRTLGLTRILLGFYLIFDLFRRAAAWNDMYSDKGVLPNYVILERPQANHFSFFHGFTTAPELLVLWFVILGVYLCLLVGYKTKVAQVVSLFIVTSMNGRVLLIENGGYVVQSLLLLWTCFMPLGDRFSVDAMVASMKRRTERTAAELNDRSEMVDPRRLTHFVSIVCFVLCAQLMAVYYFNIIHKFGPGWKRDWSAVHYVMYVDRMVTPIIANTREHIPYWMLQGLTLAVVAGEAGIGFCTMLPQLVVYGFDVKLWLKRIGLVLINFLHLGFGSTFVLGPFAWALCVFSSLLISYEDWQAAIKTMRRTKRAREVVFDASSGATLWLCRILARMDRFGLLTFVEAKNERERYERIAVRRPGQAPLVGGRRALGDIVSALPIGPVFAWIVRGPLGPFVDLGIRIARGRASRFFGFTTALPEGKPPPRALVVPRTVGRLFSEGVCLLMAVAAFFQAVTELWSTQRKWKENVIAPLNKATGWQVQPQPEVMQTLTHKMRFLQGWFMFSPNPVTVDGTVIVDAITVDGRHIDPFMYAEPNFDLIHTRSFRYNQIWSDYFNRIQGDGARAYQKPMLEYMRRLPERTGNPNDELVSGEVWWISDHNPIPAPECRMRCTRAMTTCKNACAPDAAGCVDECRATEQGCRALCEENKTTSFGQQKNLLFSFGPTGPPVYTKAGPGS